MSFPILLNLNNQVATHQFRYRFSQPIDFSKYEVALGSISIYYSWRVITAQRQNNSFKIIWPTASTTTKYTITLPDGTCSASDINNYPQYQSIQNNLYLTNNTTEAYYYFISCAKNPSSYALQFTMQSIKNISGYTAVSGFPTMSVTAYTPQLQVVDAAFGSIIGFLPARIPRLKQRVLMRLIVIWCLKLILLLLLLLRVQIFTIQSRTTIKSCTHLLLLGLSMAD